jgi:hypothetical protein
LSQPLVGQAKRPRMERKFMDMLDTRLAMADIGFALIGYLRP